MTRFATIIFYTVIAVYTIWLSTKVKDECFCLERNQRGRVQNRIVLTFIYIILSVISILRFNVGNDYFNYANTAHEVYVNGYVVTEIGFNWIVKLIYNIFGTECYEVVFAFFSVVTLYIFLKALYEQSDIFSQAYFLFMTFGLYFQTFNTMRYYLALAVSFYGMRYVIKKDWLRFVGLILIASLFHKSVLFVIPIYFLATLDWNKWVYIVIAIIGAFCFLLKGPVLKLALVLYPSYRDTVYLEGGVSKVSIVKCILVMAFTLYIMFTCNVEERKKDEIIIYSRLNYLALIVNIFFSFLPVITRIGYYLSVFQILLLPILINQIKVERRAKLCKKILIIVCVIYFIVFLLTADKEGVGLVPYQSWLFESERLIFN